MLGGVFFVDSVIDLRPLRVGRIPDFDSLFPASPKTRAYCGRLNFSQLGTYPNPSRNAVHAEMELKCLNKRVRNTTSSSSIEPPLW